MFFLLFQSFIHLKVFLHYFLRPYKPFYQSKYLSLILIYFFYYQPHKDYWVFFSWTSTNGFSFIFLYFFPVTFYWFITLCILYVFFGFVTEQEYKYSLILVNIHSNIKQLTFEIFIHFYKNNPTPILNILFVFLTRFLQL